MTLIEWEQKEHKMTAEMNQSSQTSPLSCCSCASAAKQVFVSATESPATCHIQLWRRKSFKRIGTNCCYCHVKQAEAKVVLHFQLHYGCGSGTVGSWVHVPWTETVKGTPWTLSPQVSFHFSKTPFLEMFFMHYTSSVLFLFRRISNHPTEIKNHYSINFHA